MIYDCFSYWDEDLLLDLRLKILNKFVDYFGFELDVDRWLSFYTTISKCVKFENYDSMKWYSKQKGLVQLKQTGKSGQFDWDEGWKSIKSIHTSELLEEDLLLHISSINPDTKEWNEKFGINFEQQHYELDQADEPGSISIVRGSSYIKVKQAYSFDESFFSIFVLLKNKFSLVSNFDLKTMMMRRRQVKTGRKRAKKVSISMPKMARAKTTTVIWKLAVLAPIQSPSRHL